MPTEAEIKAARDAAQLEASSAQGTADTLTAILDSADAYDTLAALVEGDGAVTLSRAGSSVTVSGAAAVAQVVTYLRNRATAIRDSAELPA